MAGLSARNWRFACGAIRAARFAEDGWPTLTGAQTYLCPDVYWHRHGRSPQRLPDRPAMRRDGPRFRMRCVCLFATSPDLAVVRERFPAASRACGRHIEASGVGGVNGRQSPRGLSAPSVPPIAAATLTQQASTVILDLGGVSWYTFWSMRSVLSKLINRASVPCRDALTSQNVRTTTQRCRPG